VSESVTEVYLSVGSRLWLKWVGTIRKANEGLAVGHETAKLPGKRKDRALG